MKAHVSHIFTQKELRLLSAEVDKRIVDGLSKVQWIMLLAFHQALGIGEQRILQVMQLYTQLLEEFKGYQRDEVADEKLTQAMKAILPNSFSRLYE